MKKIRYPLIVSDFDGTLANGKSEISARTEQTVREYVLSGGTFGICTGRMLTSILPRARSLGLKGLVAAYQGAVIADIESGKVLLEGGLTVAEGIEICEAFEQMGLHIHLYELNGFYANMDDEALHLYERICGVKAEVVKDKPLSALLKEGKVKPVKVLVMVEAEKRESVYQEALKRLGDKFYVTYSAAFLVEVTSKQYSKATALAFLADHCGVSKKQTVAVGDSMNDLPMIQSAGVGFAVKNADARLKEYVPVFGYSNDEDAVARIVEEYGFTKE